MTNKNCLFIILFINCMVLAQEKQSKSIDNILDRLPNGTKYSVFVYDPLSDDTIYAKNIRDEFIPASNAKLFTTAAILHYLGPDFQIHTKFLTDDFDLSDSVINGNLYVQGSGDPSITPGKIDSIAHEIRELGIIKITGNIFVDETIFDSLYTRDDWITVVLPPVSGLIVNRNTIHLRLFRKKSSANIEYEVTPNYKFINVTFSNTKTNRIKSELTHDNKSTNIEIVYNGNQRFTNKYISKFVTAPDIFFGQVVKAELEQNGIEVQGDVRKGITPGDLNILALISTPIEKLLSQTNKDSNNFYAECLFKILGRFYSGEKGNSFYATQSIISYLDEIGIPVEKIDIVDGSGISRFNKVTSATIVALLSHIYLDDETFPVFYNSLSIAGTDGTLEKRISTGASDEKFRGKTGTLNKVCTLSGYLSTNDGRDLVVSILFEFSRYGWNFYRGIQDEIISQLLK